MQTRDGLERVARECVLDLAADGVVWGEIRWAPEQHLTPGAREQVFPANDHVDALLHVVHHDAELVGPVPEPVAHEHVAALCGRHLALRPEAQVVERDDLLVEMHTTRARAVGRLRRAAAGARVARLLTGSHGPDDLQHVAP